jgi:hypothetical protein
MGRGTCQFVWTISMLEKFGFLLIVCCVCDFLPRCMVTRLEKQCCILDHTDFVFALCWGWVGVEGTVVE